MTKNNNWKVPFYRGNMETSEPYWKIEDNRYEWKEPLDFCATLQIIKHYNLRSTSGILVKDTTTKITYGMNMSWLVDMISKTDIIRGVFSGRFGFVKRGSNYSIKYLGEISTHD